MEQTEKIEQTEGQTNIFELVPVATAEMAIKKIEDEIIKNTNGYVAYIGAYLIGFIHNNTKYASNILKEDKNIEGSLKHMESIARKKAVKGMAILTDEEGYAAVLQYYVINEKTSKEDVQPVQTEKKKINISLDDLL